MLRILIRPLAGQWSLRSPRHKRVPRCRPSASLICYPTMMLVVLVGNNILWVGWSSMALFQLVLSSLYRRSLYRSTQPTHKYSNVYKYSKKVTSIQEGDRATGIPRPERRTNLHLRYKVTNCYLVISNYNYWYIIYVHLWTKGSKGHLLFGWRDPNYANKLTTPIRGNNLWPRKNKSSQC